MRLQPLFYKFLLVESTNSHIFLAPTKIKFSSYNWVEAPTSTCTSSNLYKENKQFSLAPPFHPCFSDLKHVQYNIQKNAYNIAYQLCSDLLLDLCTLAPLIIFVVDIQSPPSFCDSHFADNTCIKFSVYREHPSPFITHLLLYTSVLKPCNCS